MNTPSPQVTTERLDELMAEYEDGAAMADACDPGEMIGMTSAKAAHELFADVVTALRELKARRENIDALLAANAALREQVARMEPNARRYEWLRGRRPMDNITVESDTGHVVKHGKVYFLGGEDLDAAVDTARAGGEV
jgi:hypothetical protein